MMKNIVILLLAAVVIALPFIFRQSEMVDQWKPGDPELIAISPHNEAIRYEFGRAFSRWHEENYGDPVRVEWRVMGGTTEIMRYLAAEYAASFRAWWKGENRPWPVGAEEMILDRRFKADNVPQTDDPDERAAWEQKRDLHQTFRTVDDPAKFSCKVDLFFGGGTYDHNKAFRQGLSVRPWAEGDMPAVLSQEAGDTLLIPKKRSGETWRSDAFFGNALSTFGICYNMDRLTELGIENPPSTWEDLADPRLVHQLGVADPTKSGSIAKAFEMIIHEQCHAAVRAAGFSPEQTAAIEDTPREEHPEDYEAAIAQGWLNGLRLVQKIGANARYFTDSSGKVPLDVSMGDAAAGIAIDFYGRYQSEISKSPEGKYRMVYTTPVGGSSVSADPISLLRGAPHRETAVRFIEFVLSTEGQKLWNYRPGTPGGPVRFALRRLPVRRDFYPSDDPDVQAAYEQHSRYTSDDLGEPSINAYELSRQFYYYGRWTGRHFSFHRDLIKAMCMNAGEELRELWEAIQQNGGVAKQPEAVRLMERMPDTPEPITWSQAPDYLNTFSQLEIMKSWTIFFRKSYREALEAVVPVDAGRSGNE